VVRVTFWGRKKREESSEIQNLIDSGVYKELEASMRKATESTDRSTERMTKAFQDLTKALNSATREFQKGFRK
jgi:hypothetical protein